MPTLMDKVLKLHAMAKEVRKAIQISEPKGVSVVYHDVYSQPSFSIFPDGKYKDSAELRLTVDGTLELVDGSMYKGDIDDVKNALLETLCTCKATDGENYNNCPVCPMPSPRKDVLLRAAYDLLKKCGEGPHIKNALDETVFYDEADCDGNCLMEDIAIELEVE